MPTVENILTETPQCPFCGSDKLEILRYLDSIVVVGCSACGCHGPKKFYQKSTDEERVAFAIEAWSNRGV